MLTAFVLYLALVGSFYSTWFTLFKMINSLKPRLLDRIIVQLTMINWAVFYYLTHQK